LYFHIFLAGVTGVLVLLRGGEEQIVIYGFEILTIVCFAIVVGRSIKNGRFTLKYTNLEIPLFLFGLSLTLSFILSPYRYNSMGGFFEYISYILLFFLVLNLLNEKGVKFFIATLIILSIYESSLCIYQKFILGMPRPNGTLRYATYLCDFLSCGISFLLFYILFHNLRLFKKLTLLAPLSLIVYAFFLTGTRAGLINLVVIGTVFGIAKGKRWFLIFLTVIAIFFLLIPNPITERLLAGKLHDIYALERVNIWKQSYNIFKSHLFFGCGLGNFEYFARIYNFPVEEAIGRYAKCAKIAHNQYLHISAEQGLFGIVSFLSIIIILFAKLKTHWIPKTTSTSGVSRLPFFAIVLFFLAHFFFDNSLYLPANAVIFFSSLGILARKLPFTEFTKKFNPSRRYVIYLIIITLSVLYCFSTPFVSKILYRKAEEFVEEKRYEDAVKNCRLASMFSPNCPVYYDGLGKLYEKRFKQTSDLGFLYLAYQQFKKAVENGRIDRIYWENFADFLWRKRKYVNVIDNKVYYEIIENLEEAIRWDPKNPFIRRKLAYSYYAFERLDESEEELKQLIELEPNYIEAYYLLGLVYEKKAEIKSANIYYNKAKKLKELSSKWIPQSDYEKNLIGFTP